MVFSDGLFRDYSFGAYRLNILSIVEQRYSTEGRMWVLSRDMMFRSSGSYGVIDRSPIWFVYDIFYDVLTQTFRFLVSGFCGLTQLASRIALPSWATTESWFLTTQVT
ncbi:hypothetical protein WJ42_06010 [Burkholderia cepacia]|nr:hypothetical protein WJ42_06010 [Burkholderia cepacia]KWC66901.1 hypothetical protein WL55_19125 [Burkholderia cepacia]